MNANELIAALQALPAHQRELPIIIPTGSWDQGKGEVQQVCQGFEACTSESDWERYEADEFTTLLTRA